MKKYLLLLIPLTIVSALLSSACSGFFPSLSAGRIVHPSYLLQFRGGGSLSTLWYLGSDAKYHYFAHYVKTSTDYRVKREELQIPDEFTYKSQKSVYVGETRIWENIEKSNESVQPPN